MFVRSTVYVLYAMRGERQLLRAFLIERDERK
jgi:hypothetical protein